MRSRGLLGRSGCGIWSGVFVEQQEQQVFLVPHVVVQGRRPDADLRGQPANGQLLPAVPIDELAGRSQDLRAGGHRRPAGAAVRCVGIGAPSHHAVPPSASRENGAASVFVFASGWPR